MKKTKILVPALAVLALGMAASVSGTFAWFTTTAATASKSEQGGTGTVVANSYSAGAVTFTVTAATSNCTALDLTDDYGLTYYYNGSVKTLDTDKTNTSGTALALGSDYAKLTITITASVASGSIANALNAFGAVTDALTTTIEVIGTAKDVVKYSAMGTDVDPSLPTQATVSTTQGSYTQCGSASSSGTMYYYDASSKTWDDRGLSTMKYSLSGGYSNSAETKLQLVQYVYWIGLSGEDSDQSTLNNTTLTFTPTLTGDGTKISF